MDFRMPYYYYGGPRVPKAARPNMDPRFGYERRREEQRNSYTQNDTHRNEKTAKIQENEIKEKLEKPTDTRKASEKSEPIFEIFGIKLYFDDLLIVALIFFLYNEGVRDNLLFISLVLLLLS